jgi:hypothetical protein
MPDLWSLVTGAASIVSLLISLADKFSTWRKYAIPLARALAGFTLGRLQQPCRAFLLMVERLAYRHHHRAICGPSRCAEPQARR